MTERANLIAQSLNLVKKQVTTAAVGAGRSVDEITLIAVTKTYPVSDVEILHSLGQRNFGENRRKNVLG